ncbi:MAG: DNA polymerase III subunit chi [Methylococcales bacterium]
MTETSFYILNTSQSRERYIVACRVAEKAYKLGQRVFILTSSTEETRTLDNLLWSFRQGSFVPHTVIDENRQPSTEALSNTVIISSSVLASNATVLINLSVDIPDNIDTFERIVEIIDQNAQIKQTGRQRYKAYQSKNIQLNTHNL